MELLEFVEEVSRRAELLCHSTYCDDCDANVNSGKCRAKLTVKIAKNLLETGSVTVSGVSKEYPIAYTCVGVLTKPEDLPASCTGVTLADGTILKFGDTIDLTKYKDLEHLCSNKQVTFELRKGTLIRSTSKPEGLMFFKKVVDGRLLCVDHLGGIRYADFDSAVRVEV